MYSSLIQEGIKNGIYLCINTLIPSLFPFMILASFMAISGVFEKPNPIFSKITEKLFYLPGYTYSAIILSFIGGYPVGAKMVNELYEKNKIDDEQLNRMMCFCTCSGPAFAISLLGSTLLRNRTIGIIIFFSQLISGILVGIICGVKAKLSKKIFYFSKNNALGEKTNMQEALINAVDSACKSIIQVCAIIILFVTIIHAANKFKTPPLLPDFLKMNFIDPNIKMIAISILEITYGCIYAANNNVSYQMIAFAVAYGGLCTHLQITSILTKTKFKYAKFFLFRVINGLLSSLIFYLILLFSKTVVPTFSTINKDQLAIESSTTPAGSLALIMLCIYFMIDIKAHKK